jgi:hypothetical protein
VTVPDPTTPVVGGYSLLAKIGEGGMGVVHLARRTHPDGVLGERVALKVLRPHIVGDPDARSRLAREVASLRRIRSRWVAEIVDADPWGPVPYVATRYVPGLSLHDHVVEEGPIQGADLRWFAAALAEGLASVHAVGVLHRDVKPSNVLMEGRAPILIDFGLARVAEDPRLTQVGWLLGTPGYLAPEILYGQEASTASDVHSWAATVAYAATGRPPFGRGPSEAILDRVRRGEHDLSEVPEPVRGVLESALAVEPERRPTLDQLRAALSSPSGVGPPAGSPDEALGAPLTRVLTQAATELVPGALAHSADRRWAVRLRRGTLATAGALVVGGATAAFPLLSIATLSLVVWLLRSGSLATEAVGQRRLRRGRRWYDGPQALLTSPWHVVESIPATILLLVWGLALGASLGLVGYAVRPVETVALALAGAASAVGVYAGPGGARVRGPVSRLLVPLAARPRRWAPGVALLILLALGLGVVAEHGGARWFPSDGSPLSGRVLGAIGAEHGTMSG